jgi:cysteine synthase A
MSSSSLKRPLKLGLRYLSPEPARICREKPRTRCALKKAGLLTPEFWLLSSESDARALAQIVSYPCVVKPPSDSSSHGVRLVQSADELIAHYRGLASWKENVRGQRLNGDVLVESLLDGPEFSVETLTAGPGETHVIGVTAKHLSAPPHFVEMGHDFPSGVPASIANELVKTVVAALAAVAFDFGPAHTEIRWTSRGPVIVDGNPAACKMILRSWWPTPRGSICSARGSIWS